MDNSKGRLIAAMMLLAVAGAAQAKSTTAVALTYDGAPIPGRVINLHITLSGKHYVYAGGCSFYSGEVYLSKGNDIIYGDFPTTLNSNVTEQQVVYVPPDLGGCIDPNSGQHYAVKVFGDFTLLTYPYQLPAGSADYSFSARFEGDDEANGSTSPSVTVSARYPNNAAIIDYILSD